MKRKYIIFYQNDEEYGKIEIKNKKIKNLKDVENIENEIKKNMMKNNIIITGCLDMGVTWK